MNENCKKYIFLQYRFTCANNRSLHCQKSAYAPSYLWNLSTYKIKKSPKFGAFTPYLVTLMKIENWESYLELLRSQSLTRAFYSGCRLRDRLEQFILFIKKSLLDNVSWLLVVVRACQPWSLTGLSSQQRTLEKGHVIVRRVRKYLRSVAATAP